MKQITAPITKASKWAQNGSETKDLKKSRIMWGTGASFLTRVGAFGVFLAANPDTVTEIAEVLGGQRWAIWAGFAVGFLADFLKTWARIDDHVKGRTR